MFRDETVLVDDIEPRAGLLLGQAVPLVYGVPDGENHSTARTPRASHHNLLVLEMFR